MNDEIKEINIKIPGQILDYVDTKEHLLDLFNYITNLQQENDNMKRKIKYIERFFEYHVIVPAGSKEEKPYILCNCNKQEFYEEFYNIRDYILNNKED